MNLNFKLVHLGVSSSALVITRQNVAAAYNGGRFVKSSICPCPCGKSYLHSKAKGVRKQLLRLPDNPNLCQSSFLVTSSPVASSYGNQVTAATIAKDLKWDLYAGVVVERKPVITQDRNDMEEKYFKMLNQLEFELSKKSDHEVRHENDIKMLEKIKKGDAELGNVTTARDIEDQWIAEAQQFVPAKRETEADTKNDVKSLQRALDSHLLLVVEQKLGNEYRWICPHSKLVPGETMKQAAERMIRDVFPDLKTKVLGNAPWGYYRYKYPPNTTSDNTVGAKVFFYKAQVVSGQPNLSGKNSAIIKDFVWLKRNELPSKLQTEYYKKLSECLIDG